MDDGSRVQPVDGSQEDEMDWASVMIPSKMERWNGYDAMIAVKQSLGMVDPDCVCVYDLEQKPTVEDQKGQPRLSWTNVDSQPFRPLQTLTSHGDLMHSKKKRPMLWLEKFGLHCYPVLPEWTDDFEMPIDFVNLGKTSGISRNDLSSMVGLGWHGATAGPYLMFLLGSIELRQDLTPLCRTLADESEQSTKDKTDAELEAANSANSWANAPFVGVLDSIEID